MVGYVCVCVRVWILYDLEIFGRFHSKSILYIATIDLSFWHFNICFLCAFLSLVSTFLHFSCKILLPFVFWSFFVRFDITCKIHCVPVYFALQKNTEDFCPCPKMMRRYLKFLTFLVFFLLFFEFGCSSQWKIIKFNGLFFIFCLCFSAFILQTKKYFCFRDQQRIIRLLFFLQWNGTDVQYNFISIMSIEIQNSPADVWNVVKSVFSFHFQMDLEVSRLAYNVN